MSQFNHLQFSGWRRSEMAYRLHVLTERVRHGNPDKLTPENDVRHLLWWLDRDGENQARWIFYESPIYQQHPERRAPVLALLQQSRDPLRQSLYQVLINYQPEPD